MEPALTTHQRKGAKSPGDGSVHDSAAAEIGMPRFTIRVGSPSRWTTDADGRGRCPGVGEASPGYFMGGNTGPTHRCFRFIESHLNTPTLHLVPRELQTLKFARLSQPRTSHVCSPLLWRRRVIALRIVKVVRSRLAGFTPHRITVVISDHRDPHRLAAAREWVKRQRPPWMSCKCATT
jgi:hypothetical protein